MENDQYNFTPLGPKPTSSNIIRYYVYQMIVIAVVVGIFLIVGPRRWHVGLVIFLIVIISLFYYTTVTKKYTTLVQIDKINNKLYLNYVTYRGEEGTTVIDLTKAKSDYKYYSSKGAAYWKLSIYDDEYSIKLQQGYLASEKYHFGDFSKNQLDEINNIISGK